MVTIRWTKDRGWHDAQVGAREPITLDPAAAVLHYGQEIFEGLKAYTRSDGSIALFRPDQNARRFQASAVRMAMPELPEAVFLQAVEELVKIDQAWIPGGEGSLYLRPFMFATEAFLGVRPSHECLFVLIASSVGSYFKGGAKAVTVWLSDRYTRAAEGGTGAAKCGGNYAASLLAQSEAIEHGCDQVVFLDAAEHRWVEELGGMNVFFVFDDGSMTTPPLKRHDPARHHPGRDHHARPQRRPHGARRALQHRAVARRRSERQAARGFRLRDGRGHLGDRQDQEHERRHRDRRRHGRPHHGRIEAKLVGIQRGEIADTEGWVRKVS
jgi:branched-chain amino acid aminotransferase